jgi:UDP-N-acetylmuramyl pentapeptide synthase
MLMTKDICAQIFDMLTTEDILEATGGVLAQGAVGGTAVFDGVSIDSRTVSKGDIFIAVRGKRLDGHRFIRKAVAKGAALVVVSRRIRRSPWGRSRRFTDGGLISRSWP